MGVGVAVGVFVEVNVGDVVIVKVGEGLIVCVEVWVVERVADGEIV